MNTHVTAIKLDNKCCYTTHRLQQHSAARLRHAWPPASSHGAATCRQGKRRPGTCIALRKHEAADRNVHWWWCRCG